MSLLKPVQFNRTPAQHDDVSAEECCAASRLLEDKGEYTNAQALLSDFCSEIGERPKVDGLSPRAQAPVLLRVGVVAGWVSSAEAIEGGGEFAVELIQTALALYQGLALVEQVGECHMEIGWCYWRAGKFVEAEKQYHLALNLLPETALRLRAKTSLRLGIVYSSTHHYRDALELYDSVNSLFEQLSVSDIVRASLHNERAAIFHSLSTPENRDEYLNKALSEYTAALFHGKKAKHKRHCALVENNIGHLLFLLGQFAKGLAHLERAGKLFKSIGDIRTFAQVAETHAQALIEQGFYAEAEKVIAGTIRTLEKAGEQSLLCENLITFGTSLARQGKAESAHKDLLRAVAEATAINDRARAGLAWLVILEEAENLLLPDGQRRAALTQAAGLLEDSQDPKIQARLLSRAVCLATQQMPTRSHTPELEQLQGLPLKEAVRRYKAHHIRQALDAANGNRSVAARTLGMTPSGLHALLAGTYKEVRHEGMKKYHRSHIQPVDEVGERRARKQSRKAIPKKPGSVEIQLTTDHLASIGPRVNDWVVAEEGGVKKGELAAVELKTGTGAVGYFRRVGSRIILDVASMQFTEFNYDESEVSSVIGKVYGWYKDGEEDSETVRPFD